jgi:anthranilate phosphoribosyltransferase
MRPTLDRLLRHEDLSEAEAVDLLSALTAEETPPAFSGAALAALRSKGETPGELRAFERGLRDAARPVSLPPGSPLLDVVGTGGDSSGSLNLSTGTGLLAAACGLRVAKHGNRSVSSRSGSADVLEALGFFLPPDSAAAAECLARTGFTFLFAPYFHPAMRAIAPVRKALGVRTVFNLVGPLANPASPPYRMMGAYSGEAAALMAECLSGMEVERAFVVHGEPGWDEPTPAGRFLLFDVRPGKVERRVEDPADYGLPRCAPADLAGGDPSTNAAALRSALEGERGAHRDALTLGAGLALLLTGEETSRRAAVRRAATAIDRGDGARLLEALVHSPPAESLEAKGGKVG